MKLSELRAEALKQIETGGVRGTDGGDHPIPKRKRGFHRALKNKKPWAINKKAWTDLINNAIADLYSNVGPEIFSGLSAWLPEKE